MKGKLITNAILSLLWLIGFIIYVREVVNIVEVSKPYYSSSSTSSTWEGSALVGILMMTIFGFTSFVMGIITLCTMRNVTQSKGLVIASGILAIFSGACGANIIVSSIAAFKVSN